MSEIKNIALVDKIQGRILKVAYHVNKSVFVVDWVDSRDNYCFNCDSHREVQNSLADIMTEWEYAVLDGDRPDFEVRVQLTGGSPA